MAEDKYLLQAREFSSNSLAKLESHLSEAAKILNDCGTIFATGSYGRLEARAESDLDVFIVVRNMDAENAKSALMLNGVQQIRLKSELIVAASESGMADFDAGGRFLETHAYRDIVDEMGSPADDYKNTFTGRMLLILESRSIIGVVAYNQLKNDVISSYFKDFPGNEAEFVPYFLLNDILRMWRTFCVNYEFFRGETSDWRVKNLKLKYTRMLTCFSAIIYLAALYRLNGTVTPEDVVSMSAITPIERLEHLSKASENFRRLDKIDEIEILATELIAEYEIFLEFVQEKKVAIKALKADEDTWRDRSHKFGASIATLLRVISGEDPIANRFFRAIVV